MAVGEPDLGAADDGLDEEEAAADIDGAIESMLPDKALDARKRMAHHITSHVGHIFAFACKNPYQSLESRQFYVVHTQLVEGLLAPVVVDGDADVRVAEGEHGVVGEVPDVQAQRIVLIKHPEEGHLLAPPKGNKKEWDAHGVVPGSWTLTLAMMKVLQQPRGFVLA